MKFSKLLILLLTTNIYALDSFCLSHAQCQNIIEESTACYFVQDDNKKCSIRCYGIQVGSFCDFLPNKKYGKCKDEDYKRPEENESNLNCKNAIPKSVIEEFYDISKDDNLDGS